MSLIKAIPFTFLCALSITTPNAARSEYTYQNEYGYYEGTLDTACALFVTKQIDQDTFVLTVEAAENKAVMDIPYVPTPDTYFKAMGDVKYKNNPETRRNVTLCQLEWQSYKAYGTPNLPKPN